jgi:hypothetical protein
MSDAKVLDQNPISSPIVNNLSQPQVGSLNKEKPGGGQNLSEFIKPAGPEISPNLSAEEKNAGVEAKSDNPNLTSEHKDLIDHAGSSIPVPTISSNSIQYSMSEEERKKQLKTGQDDSSGKWQAWLINKVIAWGLKTR